MNASLNSASVSYLVGTSYRLLLATSAYLQKTIPLSGASRRGRPRNETRLEVGRGGAEM